MDGPGSTEQETTARRAVGNTCSALMSMNSTVLAVKY